MGGMDLRDAKGTDSIVSAAAAWLPERAWRAFMRLLRNSMLERCSQVRIHSSSDELPTNGRKIVATATPPLIFSLASGFIGAFDWDEHIEDAEACRS